MNYCQLLFNSFGTRHKYLTIHFEKKLPKSVYNQLQGQGYSSLPTELWRAVSILPISAAGDLRRDQRQRDGLCDDRGKLVAKLSVFCQGSSSFLKYIERCPNVEQGPIPNSLIEKHHVVKLELSRMIYCKMESNRDYNRRRYRV